MGVYRYIPYYNLHFHLVVMCDTIGYDMRPRPFPLYTLFYLFHFRFTTP